MSENIDIEVGYDGPVASALAQKLADLQSMEESVQKIQGDRVDGITVESTIRQHHDLLDTAHDALCEHRPDELDDVETFEVVSIDIAIEETGTITIKPLS